MVHARYVADVGLSQSHSLKKILHYFIKIFSYTYLVFCVNMSLHVFFQCFVFVSQMISTFCFVTYLLNTYFNVFTTKLFETDR